MSFLETITLFLSIWLLGWNIYRLPIDYFLWKRRCWWELFASTLEHFVIRYRLLSDKFWIVHVPFRFRRFLQGSWNAAHGRFFKRFGRFNPSGNRFQSARLKCTPIYVPYLTRCFRNSIDYPFLFCFLFFLFVCVSEEVFNVLRGGGVRWGFMAVFIRVVTRFYQVLVHLTDSWPFYLHRFAFPFFFSSNRP